jgi:hypothetical protein
MCRQFGSAERFSEVSEERNASVGLVLLTETEFLLFEVENGTLLFVTGLSPRRLGFEHRPIRIGFVVDRVHWTGFSPSISGLPCQYHFTSGPFSAPS